MRTPYHASRRRASEEVVRSLLMPILKRKLSAWEIMETNPAMDMNQKVDLIALNSRVHLISVKVRDEKWFSQYEDIVIPMKYEASGKSGELIDGAADWYVYAIVKNLYDPKRRRLVRVYMIPMREMRRLPGKEVVFSPKKMRMKSIEARLCQRFIVYDAYSPTAQN